MDLENLFSFDEFLGLLKSYDLGELNDKDIDFDIPNYPPIEAPMPEDMQQVINELRKQK